MDNQRAAQWDHHQDPEQSAEDGHEHHPTDLEIEPQDHDCRHGHAETKRDRFASRARRKMVMEITATGIEALTVNPTLSTR